MAERWQPLERAGARPGTPCATAFEVLKEPWAMQRLKEGHVVQFIVPPDLPAAGAPWPDLGSERVYELRMTKAGGYEWR